MRIIHLGRSDGSAKPEVFFVTATPSRLLPEDVSVFDGHTVGRAPVLPEGVRVEVGERVDLDAGVHWAVVVGDGASTPWLGERAPVPLAEPLDAPNYTQF